MAKDKQGVWKEVLKGLREIKRGQGVELAPVKSRRGVTLLGRAPGAAKKKAARRAA